MTDYIRTKIYVHNKGNLSVDVGLRVKREKYQNK